MAEQRDPSGSTPEQPYTIHDDAGAPAAPAAPAAPEPVGSPLASEPAGAAGPSTVTQPQPDPARRGPDPVALLAGLATVAVAVLALTDTLTAVDLRWVLAGGAVVIGLIVLVAASRPRGRRDG